MMMTTTAPGAHIKQPNLVITTTRNRPVPATLPVPALCSGCGQDLDSMALVVEMAGGRVGLCVLCLSSPVD